MTTESKEFLMQEFYRNLTREEHVPIVPYVLLVFHTSNDNSESLFEEDPTEFYYKTYKEGRKAFFSITNASHLMLMKYGFNGDPEDGEVLFEWDETASCSCCKKCGRPHDYLSPLPSYLSD